MLKPASLYSAEIEQKAKALYYSKEYFYYIGDIDCYAIEVPDSAENGKYMWASVDDNGELVGYIAYTIDYYSQQAYSFGLLSFKDGNNFTLAKDLNTVLNNLLNNPVIKRIEYRCVSSNKIEQTYQRFCEKHNGSHFTLHNITRDDHGTFHDIEIFEVLKHE